MHFSAPAKINLSLRVLGRRKDGYHLLSTVMTFVDWCDTLSMQQAGEGIHFSCSPSLTDNPEDNLALRAARRMWALASRPAGVKIHLEKHLPVAAGLGGGSSDAATVMLALHRLWHLAWDQETLIREGVALGADLPIFLGQQASRAEGIGEHLTPLTDLTDDPVVLINPGIPLSTPTVFRALRAGLVTPSPGVNKPATPAVNDLQPVSQHLAPVIGDMIEALVQAGSQWAAMSGSGPTVFGIFDSPEQASLAAQSLRVHHPSWRIFQGHTRQVHPFEMEWQQQQHLLPDLHHGGP